MHAAATAGDTTRFISALGYIRNINFEDERGETALHKAARGGYKEIVQLLLRGGANTSVQAPDRNLNTPLHLAARGGHTSVVALLLENGAPTDADISRICICSIAPSCTGWSC